MKTRYKCKELKERKNMEYTNPNEVWMQAKDSLYKGMSEKERERVGCMQGMLFVGMLLAFALCLFLSSCKSVEYVPQQHTEHHWHTDSIYTTDSVIKEKETVVMMLDSAEMAKYGIQLKSAERAWLVKTAELEKQIARMSKMKADKDTVRDTITVIQQVSHADTGMTWWKKVRMTLGDIAMMVLALLLLIWVTKRYLPL